MSHAPRLTCEKLFRLGRLLDMLYKPAEIAKELGVTDETFTRSYIPAGAPVVVDAKNKTWINGQAFALWARAYLASRKNQPRGRMGKSDGFCFRCRKVIEIQQARRKPSTNRRVMVRGTCPVCKGKVCRFDKAEL